MAARVDVLQTQGVNDVYEYNEIHLDSHQADNRNTDQGAIHPRFAITPPINNAIGIKVLTAQIPFTWNVVTPANNHFTINTKGIDIPPGNYTLTSFVAWLNAYAQPDGVTADSALVWTYDERSGSLGIYDPSRTSTAPPTYTVSFSAANGPIDLFGIPETGGSYDVIGPGADPNNPTYTLFPGTANMTGSNYLLLTSASLAGRLAKNIRINGETTPHPIVLAKIPITVNPGGIILYSDVSPGYAFDMSLEQLQNIDLIMLDGTTLTPLIPRSPWSVSLMVLSQRETSVPRIRDVPTLNGIAKRLRIQ